MKLGAIENYYTVKQQMWQRRKWVVYLLMLADYTKAGLQIKITEGVRISNW